MKPDNELPEFCRTCHFFKPVTNLANIKAKEGACHLMPPKPFPMMDQRGGVAIVSIRPSVKPDDFCGEWVESDNPLPDDGEKIPKLIGVPPAKPAA